MRELNIADNIPVLKNVATRCKLTWLFSILALVSAQTMSMHHNTRGKSSTIFKVFFPYIFENFQLCQIKSVTRTLVELPYISCKNLTEVVHIRHYLQVSCKNLRFQTKLSDSGRSDISWRVRRFLQDSCRSRHFLQDSWTDIARQCLKLERYSARKCLECTEKRRDCLFKQTNFKPRICHEPCPNLRGSWWRSYSSVHVQWEKTYVSASRKCTGVNNFCYC